MMEMKKETILLFIVILIASFILTIKLGQPTPNWDEDNFFNVAQRSCSTFPFLLSSYEKHHWFYDHPLLGMYTLQATCLIPEFWFARAISAFFGILTIYLVYRIGKQMYDYKVGLLSSILMTFSIPFIALSRTAYFDTFLMFLITVSLLLFLKKNRKWAYFIGGLGVGTKYPAAILIPVFIISDYLIGKKVKFKEVYKMLILFLLGFLVSNFAAFLMWDQLSPNRGLYMEVPVAVKTFVYLLNWGYETGGLKSPSSLVYYASTFLEKSIYQVGLLPTILFFISLIYVIKKKDRNSIVLLSLTFFAFLFATTTFYSIRHLLPLLPFFYILCSYTFFKVCKVDKKIGVMMYVFLSLFLINSTVAIVNNFPYYYLYGSTEKQAEIDCVLVKETIDYINTNTKPIDKIYAKSFPCMYNRVKPTKFTVLINRSLINNITEADYAIADFNYRLGINFPDSKTTLKTIEDNFKLVKTFDVKDLTVRWIYKRQ